MKKSESRMSKLTLLAMSMWGLFLISLVAFPGSNQLTIFIPIIATIGALVTLAAIARFLWDAHKAEPQHQEFNNTWMTQSLAVIIPVLIIAGTYCAIKALWVNVDTDAHVKFLYNGFANGLGFAAIVATMILSKAQKSIYWVNQDKTLKLDEMQIQERRRIFELSYKISAWLVLLSAYGLYAHKNSLKVIINDSTNFNVIPGAMFWPFGFVAIMVFALPLIIASWPQKLSRY